MRYSPFVRAFRRHIVGRPALFFPLARLAGNRQLLDRDTELVVDGYPRSGNSFCEAAFLHSQAERDIGLKSHAHSPAQILRAVDKGIAAVLLLRAPDEAVASMINNTGVDRPDMHYRDYCAYYEVLRGHEGTFVVAPFELVLNHFDKVVEAVNARFCLQLAVPEIDDAFLRGVNTVRDKVSLARTGRLANYAKAGSCAGHSTEKSDITDLASLRSLQHLSSRRKAHSIYESLRAISFDRQRSGH